MNNMFNDDITKSIASAVKDVLEGKPAVIKEEVKYPHDMFHPKTGEKEVANNEKEHNALDAKGYTHKKNEVAQPQKPSGKLGQDSGEKDFADKHKGKKVGEKEDGTVVKEALGFKEKKLVRDLEKAIEKTGDLIKKISDDIEDSDSYQELSQGQNALEYGIRHLEDDLDKSVNEETLSEALNERKLLRVAKDLEKSVNKTGDLVREITKHEELETSGEAYGEIGKGQEMMDYGIRFLESDIKDYFKKNESVNESTITIDEAKIDVDYIGDNDLSKKLEKKFKVKIKSTGNTTADVSGSNANLIKFLKSDAYLMDNDEIEELFPELMEEVEPKEDEAKLKESEKQKAYQKFFNAALKKFGVESPGDLDDSKKKEFFNYIDKNYKSKAEEIDAKGKDEEDVNEAMSQKDMEKRLKLIKKAVEKINRQNLRNAKADAMKMMKQSGMFDEDASDEEEVDELTDKQKKLPAGLQKAIKAKEKEEVKERVHYAFDTQKAARTFQNKVDGMPMNIVKVGTGKYYIVDLRPGTKQADQEKAAKIAVSIGLSESYLEEGVKDLKNYQDRNRKGFEARAFIEIKKGNTSNKYDDDFGFTQAEMDYMDKLISKIKDMHVSSFDGGDTAPASLEFYGKKASLDKFAKDRKVQQIANKYKSKVEIYLNK